MVTMFKSLESSGLCGFLGCSADIYERDFKNFFETALVRENAVISCVQGKFIEIFEELFAGSFELPSEGLMTVTEFPKELIKEARKSFSTCGEPIKTSCKKKEMKVEFRLLNDILAKTFMAKADMVTLSSKQARWFAVQICVLKGAPDLTLGESKAFPPLNILTVKTVSTYVVKKKSVSTTTEEVADETIVEKLVKVAANRKPAPMAEPIAKKKRTTVRRAAPIEKALAIVPVQEAVPISVVPAGSPTVQTRKAPKRKLILLEETYDEQRHKITEWSRGNSRSGASDVLTAGRSNIINIMLT
ncbi:hypothetical protein F511_31414 [Dorcoceras hygrometricum]|uniref:Uncharacterized protein n=1 Tax=Dorcoceras hygrometricum TaxID=472368 RepID=A0A2Z7AFK0_9LAMI|nr:hypothetical protein F511_31414 [Dorcoceras hygrometricum]